MEDTLIPSAQIEVDDRGLSQKDSLPKTTQIHPASTGGYLRLAGVVLNRKFRLFLFNTWGTNLHMGYIRGMYEVDSGRKTHSP